MAYSAFGYRKVEQSLQKDATELSKQRCTEQIHRNTSGQACPWHIEQQLQDYAQYLCWALIFSVGLCFQEGSCCGGDDRGWDKAKPLNPHPQTSLCRFFRGGFSLFQTPFGPRRLRQGLLLSWADAGTHLPPSSCPEEAGKMLSSLASLTAMQTSQEACVR